ncbi:MAG: nuclear transport factor 2 family protein [Betaproteobacteria bacterium]|nr:nuclear transport factor 2 family protein [Betaproteobacteria bacterium]
MDKSRLDALVEYYERLGPDSIAEMGRYYAADCSFKDPFNDVRGLAAVQEVFRRMYRHLSEPRFRVTERIAGDAAVVLLWDFDFRMRFWAPSTTQRIHGATLLRFDDGGRVSVHRDYWDAAEELYERLPGLGLLMRGLKCYVR